MLFLVWQVSFQAFQASSPLGKLAPQIVLLLEKCFMPPTFDPVGRVPHEPVVAPGLIVGGLGEPPF